MHNDHNTSIITYRWQVSSDPIFLITLLLCEEISMNLFYKVNTLHNQYTIISNNLLAVNFAADDGSISKELNTPALMCTSRL